MPAIRLVHVAKLYRSPCRKTAATLEVDLRVEQGEFVFIIGGRGAGKSTLLELMCGDLEPDRGAVFVGNIDLSRASVRQKRFVRSCFATVSQESSLAFEKTIFANMCAGSRLTEWRNKFLRRHLIEKALGLVGMSGSEEKKPGDLSVSECRKVELAKAMMESPPILILDEVIDKLDNDSSWDILHLLHELNRRGTTILMATRAGQFVTIMRRRVVTLADGKVVSDAGPKGESS